MLTHELTVMVAAAAVCLCARAHFLCTSVGGREGQQWRGGGGQGRGGRAVQVLDGVGFQQRGIWRPARKAEGKTKPSGEEASAYLSRGTRRTVLLSRPPTLRSDSHRRFSSSGASLCILFEPQKYLTRLSCALGAAHLIT